MTEVGDSDEDGSGLLYKVNRTDQNEKFRKKKCFGKTRGTALEEERNQTKFIPFDLDYFLSIQKAVKK